MFGPISNPAPPPEPTPPPNPASTANAGAAASGAKFRSGAKSGFDATMLNGGPGLTSPALTGGKTLLGQ